MYESSSKSAASGSPQPCLGISLRSEASHIRASDGREITFVRGILTISNGCGADVVDLVPHISLGQEGGTVQDISGAIAGTAVAVPPGGSVSWDVYDQLLPAHQGTASKVHMFGYRAVLNWLFELSAWAAYRIPGSAGPVQTPVSRWVLRWHVPDPSTGAVELAIERSRD